MAALGLAALFGLAACSTSTSIPAATTAAHGSQSPATFLASLGPATQIASTVPANGDVNPYGIVVVPTTVGSLVEGSTLVSNFNDKANSQGTGTTIVQISPTGVRSTFAALTSLPAPLSCPGGIGLSTGLVVLPGGWVVVGSFPAGPGGALPTENPAGCLIVLSRSGVPVETWTNPDVNGPWDMTLATTTTGPEIFVSDDLSRPAGRGHDHGAQWALHRGPDRRDPVGHRPADHDGIDRGGPRLSLAGQQGRLHPGSHRPDLRDQRHPLCGRDHRQLHHGHPHGLDPVDPGDGGNEHPDHGRIAERTLGPHLGPER